MAHRHLVQPPCETPVLDWWREAYDHVFVVLNPFFSVPGFSPVTAAYGPVRRNLSPAGVLDLIKSPWEPRPNEAPDDFEDIVKRTGEPVRWSDIRAALGYEDVAVFNRTVWLWVLQMTRADVDPELAAQLSEYCRDHALYPPEEDQLPAVLEPALGQYLAALGLEAVEIHDEWRRKALRASVDAFGREAPCVELPGEKVCAISAPGLLLSWEFDDVAGLLALSDARLKQARPEQWLEGFWLGPGDYSDVFNPVDFQPRKAVAPH